MALAHPLRKRLDKMHAMYAHMTTHHLPTGTAEEMVWPGGDLGFVQQMVQESASLPRGTVHWFTSLIGRKDSLKKLRMQLYSMQVTALRTTEFSQVCNKGSSVCAPFPLHRMHMNFPNIHFPGPHISVGHRMVLDSASSVGKQAA